MVSFDSAHRAPSLALGHPVRQAVAQLVSALRREDEDPTRCPVDVEAALLPLVELREALFARGGHRPSRIPGHQMSTVYSDPSLMIQIVGAPRGFRLPPHTHSAWNVLFVAEGEMQFTSYRRTDDRSVDRQSKLEVAQDCVLSGGQAGLVGPPPDDIHELEILSDYLWMIVVTPEPEVSIRQIHVPGEGTYEEMELAPVPPLVSNA